MSGRQESFPVEKMDRALEAAIRLFTRVLDDAGVDSGYLGLRGEALPEDVSGLLARCTTYRGEKDGGETYLALGVTPDFKAFNFAPHCRLYFVLNATGICESPHNVDTLAKLARGQLSGPLVDAWLLRRWIGFMLSAADALKGGEAAQQAYFKDLGTALGEVVSAVPPDWREPLGLRERFMQFADGFPVGVGQPLDAGVPRMNGLPVTPEIQAILTDAMARLQAGGLRAAD